MLNNSSQTITDQEKINWIRLTRSQNVGPTTFFRLLDIFNNAQNALENIANYSVKGGRQKPIIIYSAKKAEVELEQCKKINAEIIIFKDHFYPKLLKEIFDPPPIITVLGKLSLLKQKTLSIVGPRNSSHNGYKFAKMIANELGKKGFIIASGLARGIDTAAHLGSIDTGTIAVIAGGINNIYPPENKSLYHDIAKKGLIISEMPFGTEPLGGNFPRRNRIISGISHGTIVAEATLRSGTLITARFAVEQNREVFAVPGSPFDPRYHGTNQLIRDGATLIQKADDVLAELKVIDDAYYKDTILMEPEQDSFIGFSTKPSNYTTNNDTIKSAREEILNIIGYAPVATNELISNLQIPTKIFNIALIQLELADKIEHKNNKICLKKI